MKRTAFLTRILSLLGTVTAFTLTQQEAEAGGKHEDVSILTYTDFGQNKGRYAIGTSMNALLTHIRTNVDQGVVIHYTDGTAPYTIPNSQGMISFVGTVDIGAAVAIGPNMIATVAHNGDIDASFTERVVGSEHSVNYAAVGVRYSYTAKTGEVVFRLVPSQNGGYYDYCIQRQSKIITDTTWNPLTTLTNEEIAKLGGSYLYHSGSGSQSVWSEKEGKIGQTGAYAYIIGAINNINSAHMWDEYKNLSLMQDPGYGNGVGASTTNPIPNAIAGGDSGSPVFIYNAANGRYEYIAAQQSGGGNSFGQARGNVTYTQEALQKFNVAPSMASGTVYLNAINTAGEYYEDSAGHSTRTWYGHATDAEGNILSQYTGVRSGLNTWADLSAVKDRYNWYAYDANAYIQQSDVDLFFSSNLVFNAEQAANTIVLNDTVDLGVGYAEFNTGELEKASFTITSAAGEGNLFNHAGYVINEGAEVHLQLTNPEDYMTEWRKNGAGDLYIDGTGNTNALLSVGGSGTTYLQQQGGWAAYNVLASAGATVVIGDLTQIARDMTIGANGGTLDMNGHSMDWYMNNTDVSAAGFSINVLTEQGFITNTKAGTTTTLTFKESGEQTFLGSFTDTEDAALKVDYQGGGTWKLHSIHTKLSHADSGLRVSNGHVILSGTLTEHGKGSETGTNQNRVVRENDWHYADAQMNVDVADGATFELGSHARLTGNVTVEADGTFILREGVHDRYEYVEGGSLLEDTYQYEQFYGLHGNVSLAGDMLVEYSEGTTTNTTLTGKLSGAGSLTVKAGTTGGTLTLAGDNSELTGVRQIVSGGVIATTNAGLGNVGDSQWLIGKQGWLASHGFTEGSNILSYISTASEGTLALSNDLTGQLSLTNHQNLFIGAEVGKTVQYGAEGTNDTLTAYDGKWNLGGGGGELVVNFKLTGGSELVLGADSSSTGVVNLANSGNDFTGAITFVGTGITLGGYLGQAELTLSYGNALLATDIAVLNNLTSDSAGMLLVNNVGSGGINLSGHTQLNLAAQTGTEVTLSGDITVASGATHYLGAQDNATLVVSSLLAGDIVIDAQGHTGGRVELTGNNDADSAATLDGDVTIQGHRDSTAGGSITLGFRKDTEIAGTVTLNMGGTLDLSGVSITVGGNLIGNGGSVQDSVGGGILVFDTTNGDTTSDADVAAQTIRKIGSGTLTLLGTNDYSLFYVDGGTLRLGSETAASRYGTFYLADGTTLDYGTYSTSVSSYSVSNSIVMNRKGKATLAQTGMSASGVTAIGGNIQLSSGTELEFTGAGSYSLGGSTFGGTGSVLSLSAAGLNLTSAGTVNMIGTLAVNNVSRLHSTAEGEDKARNIAHLELRNGATLTLDETTGTNSWVVNNLTGTGNIYWDSSTNVYDGSDGTGSASSLVLKGTGDFSGNIALNRHASNASYTHGAYLELASEKVAQNATVTLTGAENGIATMALNAATVSLAGLEGNEYAHTYAGSHSDTVYTGGAAPASTRATTLSVNTASGASYTYAGSIGHSSDTANGISLVKTGAGSQSFTGTAYVDDVTVSQGTLSFTGGNATVRGDVSVAYGSTLTGFDFNLSSGKTFTVAGSDTAGTATFGGALTLGAGTLIFDGSGIPTQASGGVALTLGDLHFDSSVASYNITFTNTAGLVADTYTLATGNWSSVLDKLTASGISAYDTSFSVNASGNLLLTLALKSGAVVWDGNDTTHDWSTTTFGSSAQALGDGAIAVFDDSAANTTVRVMENTTVHSASFLNAAKDYTIANYGGTATVGHLEKNGAGKVTIQSGLSVTDTTTISYGELEVTSPDVSLGTVTGEGTLTINWSGTGSYTLSNLNSLNIKAGKYGSSSDSALDVRNITVHTGATYTQGTGVTYGGHIIGEGGTIALTAGGLNGQMTINRDTYLNVFKQTTASLNALLIQNNGAAIIQTGSGTVAITAAGRTDLENYIVRGGTLTYNGGANHTGQGTISVENGATLKVAWGAGLEAEQINLAGGATLRLENGASGWGLSNHVDAHILVENGAIISGSSTGDNSNINGSISGSGTLNLSNTTGANTYTINSVITDGSAGALGLNLVNTYVTLTGSNTYSGGTVIDAASSITTTNVRSLGSGAVQNDGILSLGAALTAGGLSGSGIVNTNGQVLTLTNNADYTYTGTVSGQGGILQTGSGSSSFTGGVDVSAIGVSAGSLSFTGNTTTISSGGVVSDGASLTLGGNITLGGMIENSGTVSLSDGIVFNLSLSDFSDGVFTLISGDAGHIVYNDADFGAANFQLGAFTLEDFTTGGVTYEITRSETELSLTLQGYGRDLTWSYSDTTSIDDPIWDGTNQYWVDEEGQETAFRILDNVTFGPNDGNQSIAMATAVEVGDMTVQGIYTFKQNPLTVHGHFLVESSGIARFYVKPDTLGDTATVDGQLYINFNGEWTQNVDASAGSVTKQESGTLTWNPENGKLQIKNFNIKGELGTNAALQTENMILDAGAVLKLNGTASSSIGTVQSSAAIYDSGSLAMQSSGTLQLGSTEGESKLLSLSLLSGTTDVGGAVTVTGSGTAVNGGLKAVSGQLSIGKATLNINEGGALTVNQFTAGNEADGNSSVININGGELTITGSTGEDTNSASFLLAHWKSLSTVLTLNSGTLTAENTTMHMGWDSGATFKAMGGTANLKGVLFSTERNNSADHFFLGSATAGSASLNLGASGIAGIGSNDEVKFGEGTVRAVADTVNISGQTGASIELVGTKTGTIFDTNGHTITIESTLTGSGNLVKTGSGMLNINGAGSTLTGAVTVQAGTLAINPDIALASGALGNVTLHRDAILSHTGLSVGEGASLHITGSEDATATATLTGALTLGGGTFSFDASVLDSETAALTVGGGTSLSGISSQTITLANYENLELNKSYYLISGTGSLTTENFTLGALAEGYSGALSVQNGGLWLTMSSMGTTTIIWDGTDEVRSWTADAFGSYSASVLDGTAAIFDDTAANRNVLVGAASAPQGMVFNNTEGNDYVFTPTNLNTSKISTTSLELNGGGSVEIYTQLAADSVAVNAGTLVLNGQATLAQDAPLSIAAGAELNITGTSQTLSNLTLASGATITDYDGAATLTLVKKDGQTMDLAGTVDVGTVNTQGNISLIAGANMHTLNVQSGSATLTGDNTPAHVSLAAGTEFTREGGYTLGTGSSLSVLGSGAQVLSDTTLAGGTLWFANDVLSADTAPLTFSGDLSLGVYTVKVNDQELTLKHTVNIALEDISALSSGGTWQLATGDWSGFAVEDFTMSGAYADLASFSISGNTLSMTLAAHDVWAGTATQFSWNTSSFGPDAALPTAAMAIFDDTAANKNVSLTESVHVGSLRFNHSLAYTITGAEGAAITSAASMTKLGSGALTVNADLNIGGDVTLSGGNVTFGGATTVAGSTTQTTGIVTIAGANSHFGDYALTGGTLNVTGAGTSLGVLNANGNINFQTTEATVGGLSVNAGITIQFLKPEGAASAAYDIHNDNYDAVLNFATWHATGSRILVAEGTTLTVDRINSAWGWGNFVIDGDVVVRNTMNLSSGSRNPITGKGSLTTNYLNLTNNGTYVFDLPAVTVKNQLSVGWNGKGVLQSGVLTSETKTTQTSSSFTVQGGTLNLAGTSEFTGGTLTLASGKIDVTGGTATISNTFNMNGGTLELSGGTTTITGSNVTADAGAIVIDGGTLKPAAAAASALLGGVDSLTLTSGTLDLSGLSFSESADNAVTLKDGASFSFGADGDIALGNLAANTTYQIFNLGTDSALDGWESLTTSNFILNGTDMSKLGRISLTLGETGTFSYTQEVRDLTWSGAAGTNAWNGTDLNWTYGSSNTASEFANGDSVTFAANATVSVAQDVIVNNLTLAENVNLTTQGAIVLQNNLTAGTGSTWKLDGSTAAFTQNLTAAQVSSAATLEVGSGVVLSVTDTGLAGFTPGNITGKGEVQLNLDWKWGHNVHLGADFDGTTYIKTGSFDLSDAQVGSVLRLGDGVNTNSADSAVTLTADLILDGTSTIHANAGKSITYDGTVTGGTLNTNGGSSHTFSKTVNLAGVDTDNSAALNFNAQTTIGTLISDGGANINFKGAETTIDTATLTNGIVNFAAGEATLKNVELTTGTLKVSGGTLTTNTATGTKGGTVQVAGGELALAGGTAYTLLEWVDSFSLASGTLNLESADFNTNPINLKAGAEFSFTGGTIALGALQDGVVYSLFDLGNTDTSLTGWDTLTVNNFTLGGVAMSDIDGARLSLGADGTFSYSIAGTLYWNGGDTGNWNTAETVWNAAAGGDSADNIAFAAQDRVVFGSSAAVTVTEAVEALTMTISPGADLSLSLAEGASVAVTNGLNLNGTLRMSTYAVNGVLTVAAGNTGTLVADTAALSDSNLLVETGGTLNLQGGAYSISGSILSADNAGTINFSASSLTSQNDATTTLWGTFNVTGNTTLDVQRTDNGDWALNGLNVAGSMTVAEDVTLTVTGDGRLQVNDGGTLLLKDGAKIDRTSAGAFYIKGSLATAENATATFKSTNDVHLDYVNSGKGIAASEGSIDVAAGSTLQMAVLNLTTWGKAQINVGSGATLDVSSTSNVNLQNTPTITLAEGAKVLGTLKATGTVALNATGAASVGTLNVTGGTTTLSGGGSVTVGALSATGGALTVDGAGLVLNGTATISNTFTLTGGALDITGGSTSISGTGISATGGAVELSAGSLSFGSAGAAAAIMGGADSFTLSGGTLNLANVGVSTDSANAIALADSAQVSLGGSGVLELGALEAGQTYYIFSGATPTDWNQLTAANFSLSGTNVAEMSHAVISLATTDDGASTFSYTMATYDLVWDGGATGGVWNSSDTNWDGTNGDIVLDNVAFANGDRVTFTYDAALSVPQAVHAAALTVNENITVSLEAGETVTVDTLTLKDGATLHANINTGTNFSLVNDGTAHLDTLTLTNGGSLTLSPAENTELSLGALVNATSLTMQGAGALAVGDATLTAAAGADALFAKSGTLTLTGTIEVEHGRLAVSNATVNINSGADVTLASLRAGTNAEHSDSLININGGKLTITGTANERNENPSILLAHWKHSDTVLTLNSGELSAAGAIMYTSWSTAGTFKALGGSATLLGIDLQGDSANDRWGHFVLGAAGIGSSTVTLGDEGIKNLSNSASVTLGHGTLKAAESFSITGSNAISMVASASETLPGTIFDTNGNTITVATAVSGSGAMVKRGEGTLAFTAASTGFSGSVVVEAGTLQVDATSASLLGGASALALTGGVLDLSALGFTTDASGALALADTVNFTVGADGVLNLGALEADNTYYIFSGGAPAEWENLQVSNFALGGTALADMGNVSLTLAQADGYSTFSYTIVPLLYWTGSTDANWNTTTTNWDATPDVSDDADVIFSPGADVVFNANGNNKAVVLESDVTVNKMTVSTDGYSFAPADADSTASITMEQLVASVSTNDGALKLGTGAGTLNITVNESSAVTGALDVYWGTTLNLKGLSHEIDKIILRANKTGSALNISSETAKITTLEMRNTSSLTLGTEDGSTQGQYEVSTLSIQSNANTRAITIHDGSTLAVETMKLTGANHTTTLSGAGSLAVTTLNVTQGTLNIDNASTSVTTANLTGGSINVGNGSTTITTAQVTAGAVTLGNTATYSADSALGASISTLAVSGGTLNVTAGGVDVNTLTLSGGELVLGNDAATGLLESAAGFTMSGGGVLDLSALSFTETADQAISLASGAEFNFNGGVIELGALTQGVTYQIFDVTNGGTLSGWESLTLDNFTVGGSALAADTTLVLDAAAGTFSYTMVHDQYWDTTTGNWNTTDTNWDSAVDGGTADNVAYLDGRNAIFTSKYMYAATLTEAVSAAQLTVKDGILRLRASGDAASLTVTGGLTVEGGKINAHTAINLADTATLSIAENTSWELNEAFTQSITSAQLAGVAGTISVGNTATLSISDTVTGLAGQKVSGEGTVELTMTDVNWNGTIQLGTTTDGTNSFTGKTVVKDGKFTINGSTYGSVLHLNDGASGFQLTGAATVDAALEFDGNIEVHQNGGAQLTMNGTVTGAGTWERKAHGNLYFNQAVSLGGFNQSHHASAANYFNAATTIGTLNQANATTTFNGATTITTANLTGGTVKFGNGGTTITTANVTSGTVALADSATYNAETAAASSITTLAVSGGSLDVTATGLQITTANISGGSATFGGNGSYTFETLNLTNSAAVVNINADATFTKEYDKTKWTGFGISINQGTLNIGNGAEVSVNKIDAIRGTLNIGTGADDTAFVTTGALEGSDEKNTTMLITVGAGSTLKITGADDTHYKTTAFMLSEWTSVTTLNVAGTLLAQNATAMMGDRGATITVDGVMAVKGIKDHGTNTDGTLNLTLNDGGKLILGASGITTNKGVSATLNGGTVGISASDVTIAEDLTLAGANGTTFDTAIYQFAADGNSVVRGTESGTLTLSGALLGTGKLMKTGAGTLVLTATQAPTFAGTMEVNAGTLRFGDAVAAQYLDSITALSLTGGMLDLSAVGFSNSADNAIDLTDAANVTISSGRVELGNLAAGNTYYIFDLTAENASIDGWTGWGNNITVGGVAVSRMADATLELTDDAATLTITDATAANFSDMYWAGGEKGVWDYATANWDRTPANADDANIVFMDGDSVIFAAGKADVTAEQHLAPVGITLESGANVTLTAESGFTLTSLAGTEDSTISLQGGAYTFSGTSIGASDSAGTVNFGGSDLDLNASTLAIWGDMNIVSNVTYTANRTGDNYDTGVTTLHGTLSVATGKTLTIDGNGRFIVEAGAAIELLGDGAEINRSAAGAYWYRGELNVAEGAETTFSTVNDLHFNYGNDATAEGSAAASINLAANSKLTLTAASIQQWGNNYAGINLAAGSELIVTNTMTLGRTSLTMADNAKFAVGAASTVGALSLGAHGTIASTAASATVTANTMTLAGGSTLTVDTTKLTVTDGVNQGEGSRVLGTTSTTATTTIIPTNGGVLDDRGSFYAVSGTLNIGDDDASSGGTVYVKGLALTGSSTLDIKSGNTFVITGTTNTGVGNATTAGKNYGDFQITTNDSETKASVINVEGTLTANSRFSVAGGNGTFNVKNGGTVNMLDGTAEGGTSIAITYNVENGGRVNIASYEATRTRDDDNDVTLKLSDGATVGGIADSSRGDAIYMLQKVELDGTGTIDTDAATYDTTSFAVTETDNGSDMVFTRAITTKSGSTDAVLKVDGHGTAHLANTATLSGGLQVEKEAALAVTHATVESNPSNSTYADLAAITSADGENAATVDGAVSISHDANTNTATIQGTDTNTAAKADNSLITIAQGASLTVDNMIISESSRISGQTAATFAARTAGMAALTATNTTVVLGEGNAEVADAPATLAQTTLISMDGTSTAVPMAGDFTTLAVNSTALGSLTLNAGSSLIIDFSSLLTDVEIANIDLIELSFADVSFDPADNITISGVLGNRQMTAYYLAPTETAVANVGNSIYFSVESIPEPTTTTLSILALAALAARRRRK